MRLVRLACKRIKGMLIADCASVQGIRLLKIHKKNEHHSKSLIRILFCFFVVFDVERQKSFQRPKINGSTSRITRISGLHINTDLRKCKTWEIYWSRNANRFAMMIILHSLTISTKQGTKYIHYTTSDTKQSTRRWNKLNKLAAHGDKKNLFFFLFRINASRNLIAIR